MSIDLDVYWQCQNKHALKGNKRKEEESARNKFSFALINAPPKKGFFYTYLRYYQFHMYQRMRKNIFVFHLFYHFIHTSFYMNHSFFYNRYDLVSTTLQFQIRYCKYLAPTAQTWKWCKYGWNWRELSLLYQEVRFIWPTDWGTTNTLFENVRSGFYSRFESNERTVFISRSSRTCGWVYKVLKTGRFLTVAESQQPAYVSGEFHERNHPALLSQNSIKTKISTQVYISVNAFVTLGKPISNLREFLMVSSTSGASSADDGYAQGSVLKAQYTVIERVKPVRRA